MAALSSAKLENVVDSVEEVRELLETRNVRYVECEFCNVLDAIIGEVGPPARILNATARRACQGTTKEITTTITSYASSRDPFRAGACSGSPSAKLSAGDNIFVHCHGDYDSALKLAAPESGPSDQRDDIAHEECVSEGGGISKGGSMGTPVPWSDKLKIGGKIGGSITQYGVDTLTRWILECTEEVLEAAKKILRANAEAVANNRMERLDVYMTDGTVHALSSFKTKGDGTTNKPESSPASLPQLIRLCGTCSATTPARSWPGQPGYGARCRGPLVFKVTLHGPFTALRNAQCSILHVPGTGDQDQLRSRRYELALQMADRIYYIPEQVQMASAATAREIMVLGESTRAEIGVVVNKCFGFGGENARKSPVFAEEFYRSELHKSAHSQLLQNFISTMPVFFVESNADNESKRKAYDSHYQDLLRRGLQGPSERDLRINEQVRTLAGGKPVLSQGNIENILAAASSIANGLIPHMVFATVPALPGKLKFTVLQSIFSKWAPNSTRNLRERMCEPIAAALEESLPVTVLQASVSKLLEATLRTIHGFLTQLARALQMDSQATDLLRQPFQAAYQDTALQFVAGWKLMYRNELMKTFSADWHTFFQTGIGAVGRMTTSLVDIAQKIALAHTAFIISSLQDDLVRLLDMTINNLTSRPLASAQLSNSLLPLLSPIFFSDVLDGTFFTRADLALETYHGALLARQLRQSAGMPLPAGVKSITPAQQQPTGLIANSVPTAAAAWSELAKIINDYPVLLHHPDDSELQTLERKRASHSPKPGVIYVMGNDAFVPGMYKIGLSCYPPVLRAKKLRTTGVPKPFRVEQEHKADHTAYFELFMHIIFKNVRVVREREFFQAPLPIIDMVAAAVSKIAYHELRST
ncbi:hypothetical protein HDU89_006765 [Geranomyces variabilis]|nr:hypothetical protein HDU89_006765 [Geranomyces variabilis]